MGPERIIGRASAGNDRVRVEQAILRLSSEKNFIVSYKGYAPESVSFGRMQSSFFTPEGSEAQGLGDSRAGNQPTPPSVRYPGGVRPSKRPRRFLFRLST
jgi:hypothetical protein